MWGAIISAAISAASSIYGGMKASEAMKKSRSRIEKELDDNQNWYDRRYNEDPTQRASAQMLLQRASDVFKKRNRAAAGTAAVMGGSQEAVAAQKEANNQTMSDIAGQIVASNDARKDRIEEQYIQNKTNIANKLSGADAQQAGQTAEAVKGVAGAAGNIANLFGKKQ